MKFSLAIKPSIGAILSVTPIGLSACATAHETPPVMDAILLNAQDSPTRQAIRVFVRKNSGSNIISDPDSLTISPILKNHQRRTDLNFHSRPSSENFKPVGDYRLVIDENNQCWLRHQIKDDVSYLELPASARCAPYTAL